MRCPDCGGAGRLAVRIVLPSGNAGARLEPCVTCAPAGPLDPGGLELGPGLTGEELGELAGELGRHELAGDEELGDGPDRASWRTLEQLAGDEELEP